MSGYTIIYAGPSINFFSINKERLLFSILGALSAPEAVEKEVLRKAHQDKRFSAAERVWRKLPPRLLRILSDDVTKGLSIAVERISGVPYARRMHSSKDLGETMVIAHAAVAAEAGEDVVILIDDGDGVDRAAKEAKRLQRLRNMGRSVGSIQLIHTATVLEVAAGGEHLPDRAAMRNIYLRLKELDDGLLPLEKTNLMRLPCWS